MPDIWYISDTHFGHSSMLKFTGNDGNLIRPGFDSIEDMDEFIIENWNKTVKPGDKIYHLGDIGKFSVLDSILPRLNGQKRLILGNHEMDKRNAFQTYLKYFEKIMESRQIDGILFVHRPPLLDFEFKIKGVCHGHIHEKLIPDPHYLNICVEHINYTPVHHDWIIQQFKDRGIL